jgi:hypothetical protein
MGSAAIAACGAIELASSFAYSSAKLISLKGGSMNLKPLLVALLASSVIVPSAMAKSSSGLRIKHVQTRTRAAGKMKVPAPIAGKKVRKARKGKKVRKVKRTAKRAKSQGGEI